MVILVRFVCSLILVKTFCLLPGHKAPLGEEICGSPHFSGVSAFNQMREDLTRFLSHLLILICPQLKIIMLKWHILGWHIPTLLSMPSMPSFFQYNLTYFECLQDTHSFPHFSNQLDAMNSLFHVWCFPTCPVWKYPKV